MNRLRSSLSLILLLIILWSCGNTKGLKAYGSLNTLYKDFISVMLDSTSSWKQVIDVVYPFTDSVCVAAVDESSLRNRMFGQEWGYTIIEALTEKYEELEEIGKEVNYDDLSKVLRKISDAATAWFYAPNEELPHIWRDHYYVSNKSAKEPVNGFLHIMVTMPSEEHPEPTLQIFYPESAGSHPAIIFRERLADKVIDEDFDMKNLIVLDNWSAKNEVEQGMPMQASADESIVSKMLSYPVMYLIFQSEDADDGTPGEIEVARVLLQPMQTLWWKEHVKE